MRLRSGVGAGLAVVAVVVAVAVLRTHSVPASPSPAPPLGTDARAVELSTDFRHTTLLPATVHFAGDFVFQRAIEREFDRVVVRYTATGLLVRAKDNVALSYVEVNVSWADGRRVDTADMARCEPEDEHGGDSCTQARLPGGVAAMVLRGPVVNLRTELEAMYPNGTQLAITFEPVPRGGVSLNDAAIIRLAAIPGISD